MFSGSCTALVTPFKEGSVDEKKLQELVEFQIANQTSALVPCGTTGESPTLTHEEHHRVIEVVVRQTRKRIPVMAATGSNSTAEAVSLTQRAQELGADAALVIVPYYNKPTQKGMMEHFTDIASRVSLPLVIYNIPGRTGANLLPQTLIELADKHKNIVGVKESSGSLDQANEIAAGLAGRENFSLLSGEDSLTLPILSIGGKGVISAAANIVPKEVSQICSLAIKGDFARARKLHLKLIPLIQALFLESNPIPVKTAMERMGLCSSEMRLPLCPMSPENRKNLFSEMEKFGLKRKQT